MIQSMIMVSKFSDFPDELSENDELREFQLSGSDCNLAEYSNDMLGAFSICRTV